MTDHMGKLSEAQRRVINEYVEVYAGLSIVARRGRTATMDKLLQMGLLERVDNRRTDGYALAPKALQRDDVYEMLKTANKKRREIEVREAAEAAEAARIKADLDLRTMQEIHNPNRADEYARQVSDAYAAYVALRLYVTDYVGAETK